jgi:hypothetical protein
VICSAAERTPIKPRFGIAGQAANWNFRTLQEEEVYTRGSSSRSLNREPADGVLTYVYDE